MSKPPLPYGRFPVSQLASKSRPCILTHSARFAAVRPGCHDQPGIIFAQGRIPLVVRHAESAFWMPACAGMTDCAVRCLSLRATNVL